MKKILYISDIDRSSTLFNSQVLPHVELLRKYFSITLIEMSRGGNNACYKSWRADYFLFIAFFCFFRNSFNLIKIIKLNDIDLVYGRGVRGGIVSALVKIFLFKKKIISIVDMRADVLDESGNNYLKKFLYYMSTKFSLKFANYIFFVSSRLQKKYLDLFNYNCGSSVCPTFVPDGKFRFSEAVRIAYRERLGFSRNDIVLLYSGNGAKHQNVETIFSAFFASNNKNLWLLVLSKDARINEIANKFEYSDKLKVISSDYNEIQNFYCAADFAILIRDDIDTNRCSSPTKFSEYVNSGLPLIVTKIDADYIDIINSMNIYSVVIESKSCLLSVFNSLNFVNRNSVIVNELSGIVNAQVDVINNFS